MDGSENKASLLFGLEFHRNAVKTVQQLCEEKLPRNVLKKKLACLTVAHFTDLITERALIGRCGSCLCENSVSFRPRDESQPQYRISLQRKKVINVQESSKFCSSSCYSQAEFIKKQLSARDALKKPEALEIILDVAAANSGGSGVVFGEEVELERVPSSVPIIVGNAFTEPRQNLKDSDEDEDKETELDVDEEGDDDEQFTSPSSTMKVPRKKQSEDVERVRLLSKKEEEELNKVIEKFRSVKLKDSSQKSPLRVKMIDPLPLPIIESETLAATNKPLSKEESLQSVIQVEETLRTWTTWETLEYILGSREELIKMVRFHCDYWKSSIDNGNVSFTVLLNAAHEILEQLKSIPEEKSGRLRAIGIPLSESNQGVTIRTGLVRERLKRFEGPIVLLLDEEEQVLESEIRPLISTLHLPPSAPGALRPRQWELLNFLFYRILSIMRSPCFRTKLEQRHKEVVRYLCSRFGLDPGYLSRFEGWLFQIDYLLMRDREKA